MSGPRSLCTFTIGGDLYGIDVQRVQEIIRHQDVTPVPMAPPEVRGLINLRGQIVPAIDLRRRLGLPELDADRLPINVVLRSDDGPVSLMVDEIGDVLELASESFEPTPKNVRDEAIGLIHGVYKLSQGLLLHLRADVVTRLGPAPHADT